MLQIDDRSLAEACAATKKPASWSHRTGGKRRRAHHAARGPAAARQACRTSAPSAVVRTTMVRRAFNRLSDVPAQLFYFSDDMDELRKCQQCPTRRCWQPISLCCCGAGPIQQRHHPRPGAANNARLQAFLDSSSYVRVRSATEPTSQVAQTGILMAMLQRYDEVQAVMLPTLGPERRASCRSSCRSPWQDRPRAAGADKSRPMSTQAKIVYRDEDKRWSRRR